MALAKDINDFARPGLLARLGDKIATELQTLRQGLHRRAVFRSTYCELSALSDRDLADIGVARGEIARLALDAAKDGEIG